MKTVKIALSVAAVIIVMFALYRILFIRTVNYQVGGIDIPSEYNLLTGKVTPIQNYKGTKNLPSYDSYKNSRLGLDASEATVAHLRWSTFEEWIKRHPEYKGWESDQDIFKKANEAFRKDLEGKTRAIVIK